MCVDMLSVDKLTVDKLSVDMLTVDMQCDISAECWFALCYLC